MIAVADELAGAARAGHGQDSTACRRRSCAVSTQAARARARELVMPRRARSLPVSDDSVRPKDARPGADRAPERAPRRAPGVQVLFAFLLAVPFANGWTRVTELQRDVFFLAFIATAAASILLIAPSSYHRLRWRARDKEQCCATSNRLAIAGTVFLALGMIAVVFLIRRHPLLAGGRRSRRRSSRRLRLVLVRAAAAAPRGLAAPTQRDPGQDLAHDPVGDEGGDVGRADGGRDHLDHLGAHELEPLARPRGRPRAGRRSSSRRARACQCPARRPGRARRRRRSGRRARRRRARPSARPRSRSRARERRA